MKLTERHHGEDKLSVADRARLLISSPMVGQSSATLRRGNAHQDPGRMRVKKCIKENFVRLHLRAAGNLKNPC